MPCVAGSSGTRSLGLECKGLCRHNTPAPQSALEHLSERIEELTAARSILLDARVPRPYQVVLPQAGTKGILRTT